MFHFNEGLLKLGDFGGGVAGEKDRSGASASDESVQVGRRKPGIERDGDLAETSDGKVGHRPVITIGSDDSDFFAVAPGEIDFEGAHETQGGVADIVAKVTVANLLERVADFGGRDESRPMAIFGGGGFQDVF